MREEKWYDVPGRFLRQHGKTGIIFLVYCVIFAGIFILYDLEAEAVLYAAGLCLLFRLTVLVPEYCFFAADHRERDCRSRRTLVNQTIRICFEN